MTAVSQTLSLNLHSAATYFVDVQVESGKGYIGPVVIERGYDEAILMLEALPETW